MNIKFVAAVAAVALYSGTAGAEQFLSAHAQGHCITNSSGVAQIQGCVQNAGNQTINMRWIAAENVFFGPLTVSGQCLEARGQGNPLVFTACRPGPAQEWKLTGANGVLNNGQGLCADLPGGTRQTGSNIIAWACNGGTNQKWLNAAYARVRVIAVPNMRSQPAGTPLQVVNGNIVGSGAGNVIAAGAGNIVAAGAGNVIAAGAGNIVVTQPPN